MTEPVSLEDLYQSYLQASGAYYRLPAGSSDADAAWKASRPPGESTSTG